MAEYSLSQLLAAKFGTRRPKIVVLCGSTRFLNAFREANLRETLAGHIVLSIGCDTKSDDALALGLDEKFALDLLHLHKIDLADEVIVLNVGGYMGSSTLREVRYAFLMGKSVRFLEPVDEQQIMLVDH
jgi:hypothetical protein